MKIINAKVYINGAFEDGGLCFDERITAAGAGVAGEGDIDAGGCYIIPGLVDIHTHGAMGADASDGDPEGLLKMSRYLASQGVTSWCPTTMTLKEKELTAAVRTVRDFNRPADGARIAGIHLEGPFINPEKMGAQNPENIAAPDIDMFMRLNDESGGKVRLITMAPEVPGGIAFVKEASRVCTVSVGHTMADYDTAMAAYAAGASHATHLYNAMPPLHHRAPGVIGAAYDSGATAELICDGLHVHPSVVRLTHRLFGRRMVLISDALRCTGMLDGDYDLGGQQITLKDGRATLKSSDTLAGSTANLMQCLKRCISFGVPPEDAVYAATAAPAGVIKAEKEIGSLSAGCCADFVILDNKFNVADVYVGGKKIEKP